VDLLSPATATSSEALAGCQRFLARRWKFWPAVRHVLPLEQRSSLISLCAWHELVRERLGSGRDSTQRLAELDRLASEIERVFAGELRTPIAIALAPTVRRHGVAPQAFLAPLEEQRRSEYVGTFETRGALLAHARAIACPEAGLLLAVLGKKGERNEVRADALAIGLQLAAWTTRLVEDLELGRLHVPIEDLDRHRLAILDLHLRVADERTRALVRDQIAWARSFLAKGWPLVDELGRVRGRALAFVLRWNAASLSALEVRDHDVFAGRPPAGWPRILACAAASAANPRCPPLA
jgi:phytoene/squalene synthetase